MRYARSFLQDLRALEPAAYQQIYEFAFNQFTKINYIQELPDLRALGSSAIFYRFSLDNYTIGIEVKGQIIKFLRILPKPDI